MGFIYSIKNKVNGHEYIGQTRGKKVETRWNQHKRDPGGILQRAFNAHGIDAFNFTIVCEIPTEELNEREILEIKERNTLVPNGYNLQEGGKSYGCHPETRKKLSELKKGNTYNFGKKTPPSTIAKMREAHSGPKHHMYGKHLPEWVKDILRKSQPSTKKVDQYTKDGAFVKTWDSIKGVAKTLDISDSHISECCRGILKTYKSFVWRYHGVGVNDVKKRKNTSVYNPLTQRAYYIRNRERYAALRRKYYMNRTPEQKERDRESRRLWARAHPRILTDSQKLKLREYYRKNSDILKKKNRERYAKLTPEEKKEVNKKKKKYPYKPLNEIQNQRAREYRKKHMNKIKAQARERRRNRTPEQKARDYEKMKEWRRNNPRPPRVLTDEQKKMYKERVSKEALARYEAKRKEKRHNRTPEQIEQDNKARKEKRTPEKDEARRQRRKELEASITEEQKEKRRAQTRERRRNRTPEQIEKEKERGRRRYEELKNKKLQNNKDDGSLQGNSSGDSLSGVAVAQNA